MFLAPKFGVTLLFSLNVYISLFYAQVLVPKFGKKNHLKGSASVRNSHLSLDFQTIDKCEFQTRDKDERQVDGRAGAT